MLARYVGAIDDPHTDEVGAKHTNRPRRRGGERSDYGGGVLREARRERLVERAKANHARRLREGGRYSRAESTPPTTASSAVEEVRMGRSKSTGAAAASHQRRQGQRRAVS